MNPAFSKQTVIFLLPSIHHVLRGEKVLKRVGAPFDLVPVPKEVNPDCGMAIEAMPPDADSVRATLTESGIPIETVYVRNGKEFRQVATETVFS